MKNLLMLACLISFTFLGCNDSIKKHKTEEIGNESVLSKIRLSDLSNSAIELDQYKGKTIFINFWATWCKPCLAEMPSIQKAMEILKNENIEFLFASDETKEQIESFNTKYNYPFNFVRVENMEEINIMALPTTFIFNADSKLVFNEIGFRKWDDKGNIDLILNIINTK